MRILKGLLVASLFVAGCGGANNVASDEAALDSTEATSGEAALFSSAASIPTSGITGAAIAADIAAGWSTQFQPAGCATSTAAGNVVTLTTNACTGPYGLVAVTGTMLFTITPALKGYTVHATTTGLQVNHAKLDIDSTFAYADNGTTKSVTAQVGGSATGPRGHVISRTGSYTATWTSTCIALDGMWSTTFAGITYQTTVDGYSQCKGACPAAGGSISWSGASRSVTIEFDGSSTADVTVTGTARGGEGSFSLFCAS